MESKKDLIPKAVNYNNYEYSLDFYKDEGYLQTKILAKDKITNKQIWETDLSEDGKILTFEVRKDNVAGDYLFIKSKDGGVALLNLKNGNDFFAGLKGLIKDLPVLEEVKFKLESINTAQSNAVFIAVILVANLKHCGKVPVYLEESLNFLVEGFEKSRKVWEEIIPLEVSEEINEYDYYRIAKGDEYSVSFARYADPLDLMKGTSKPSKGMNEAKFKNYSEFRVVLIGYSEGVLKSRKTGNIGKIYIPLTQKDIELLFIKEYQT